MEIPMTTPDIAGQCEKLRKQRRAGRVSQMLINPDGPEAANTLERQAAEIKRLRELLRCIRDTPANEFDAVDVANRIRAALTGEDT